MIEQPAVFTLKQGTLPLLISIPHAGTHIPDDIAATMKEGAEIAAFEQKLHASRPWI